jgi:hypothetical protein
MLNRVISFTLFLGVGMELNAILTSPREQGVLLLIRTGMLPLSTKLSFGVRIACGFVK